MGTIAADFAEIDGPPRTDCASGDRARLRFLPPSGPRGAVVLARDLRWRVRDWHTFEACALAGLVPAHGNPRAPLTLITPADVITVVPAPPAWRRVSMVRSCVTLAHALRAVLGAPGLPATSLAVLPWQFAAARALVEGHTSRVLIADEVGLGKTVQAALAVHVLRAAGRADRVLILTPAGLRDQWCDELWRLFRWSAIVGDARELRGRRGSMPPHVSPWTAPGITIASLDFVKQPEVLASCAAIPWDIVIIDEAHALAPGTDRLAAAGAIGRAARRVLLLTGTPHSGDDEAFDAMCEVGSLAGEGGAILVIRRSAAAIGRGRQRRLLSLEVRRTTAEARVHAQLDSYVRRVWTTNAAGAGPARRLAMTVLLKRSASSMAALARSLAHRVRCLEDAGAALEQSMLPFDEPGEIDQEDVALPAVLAAPGLADRGAEIRILHELVAAAVDAIPVDPKLQLVARFVRRAREPILVFTEYRDTLHAVVERIGSARDAGALHGAMSRRERGDAVRAFANGRLRVLVATDVAAEGLNLHEHCRTLVNMELPWTPTRLEQRIGRVDRLGQSRRVHAVHLLRRDGVEPWLASRLAARAARARRSLRDDLDGPARDDVATTAAALDLQPASRAAPARRTFALGRVSVPEYRDDPAADQAVAAGASAERRDPDRLVSAGGRHELNGLTAQEIARIGHGDALLGGALARLRGSRVPIADGPCIVRLSRRLAQRVQLPEGITFIVRIGRAVGGWTPAPALAAIAVGLDWRRAPGSCAATIGGLMPLVRSESARLVAHHDESTAALRFTLTSLGRERALMGASQMPGPRDHADPLQPGLFDRRAERDRLAADAIERQRSLQHGSCAFALEADALAGPELVIDPLVAFVVR